MSLLSKQPILVQSLMSKSDKNLQNHFFTQKMAAPSWEST